MQANDLGCSKIIRNIKLGYFRIGIEEYFSTSSVVLNQLNNPLRNFVLPDDIQVSQKLIIGIGLDEQPYELIQNRIIDQKNNKELTHHWLYAPKKTRDGDAERIISSIEAIAVQWHANERNGLLLHAAAACSQGQGFIFLGKGGAGKSTAALNSTKLGLPVLGEDRIFVLSDENQQFILSIAPKIPTQITTHPELHPPLKGIFILKKAKHDRLVPISQKETAKMVFKAFKETAASSILSPALFKNAFHLACDIARQVPGYDLYLRNSPNFWKLIDAEFPVE